MCLSCHLAAKPPKRRQWEGSGDHHRRPYIRSIQPEAGTISLYLIPSSRAANILAPEVKVAFSKKIRYPPAWVVLCFSETDQHAAHVSALPPRCKTLKRESDERILVITAIKCRYMQIEGGTICVYLISSLRAGRPLHITLNVRLTKSTSGLTPGVVAQLSKTSGSGYHGVDARLSKKA